MAEERRIYEQYIEEVEKNPAGKEAGKLINVLTTNHTYFMREFEHMDYLKRVILPWIMNSNFPHQ